MWNYTNQFKREIELGLDIGIRQGMSADELSRQLRDFLKYPDKLFRRVRDEHGQLQLSKAASEFHPGRGVYRSSYKNARRLAVTETNMAYRSADHERWQQMDFVVGIHIEPSNTNHPIQDICDDLKGDYPKDFKFTGWHPHCRCHVLTILKTMEEMADDAKRIMRGEEPSEHSVNQVTDVPKEFSDWVRDNASRIVRANKLPNFMTDNEKYVVNIMQQSYPSTIISKQMVSENFNTYVDKFKHTSERVDALQKRLKEETLTDMQRAIIINQLKQECAALTYQDLRTFGMVGEDWTLARTELNSVIEKGQTLITTDGKLVQIKETKLDILIFKNGSGREFAYPVGAEKDLFNAIDASNAIDSFPPYLREGIKRVSFLNIPCPTDRYWELEYNRVGFKAAATDGGKTTFYKTPKDVQQFKELMAHEAGHIIDKDYRFSESKGWIEAVAKDNEIYKKYPKYGKVSEYATASIHEDFAESVRRFINEKKDFKEWYPNRAAYLRSLAQRLSGYFPKTQ